MLNEESCPLHCSSRQGTGRRAQVTTQSFFSCERSLMGYAHHLLQLLASGATTPSDGQQMKNRLGLVRECLLHRRKRRCKLNALSDHDQNCLGIRTYATENSSSGSGESGALPSLPGRTCTPCYTRRMGHTNESCSRPSMLFPSSFSLEQSLEPFLTSPR